MTRLTEVQRAAVERSMPLVHAAVSKAVRKESWLSSLESDLIQEGALELMAAVQRFEPSRGDWAAYASTSIRWKVRNAIRAMANPVSGTSHGTWVGRGAMPELTTDTDLDRELDGFGVMAAWGAEAGLTAKDFERFGRRAFGGESCTETAVAQKVSHQAVSQSYQRGVKAFAKWAGRRR